MAATSIHIEPCRGGSESHNLRDKELDYVRKELTHLNESIVILPIKECFKDIKTRYELTVGQKMQAKATPIREGVVVIEQGTTMAQLQDYAKKLEERFGIKTIQIHIHKDEGHKDSKEWKPNLHAHMVFNWTDDKGKSLKLNKQDLSEIQTILAETIGMERGKSSDVKHLSAVQFKIEQETQRLQSLEPKPLSAVMGFLTAPLTQQASENKQLQSEIEAIKRTTAIQLEKSFKEIETLKKELNKAEESKVKALTDAVLKFGSWFPLKEMAIVERECKEIQMPQEKIDTLIREKELNYTGDLFSPGHARIIQVENIDFSIKENKLTAKGTTIAKMFDWIVNLYNAREAQRLENIRIKEAQIDAKLTPLQRELKQQILDNGGSLKDWKKVAKELNITDDVIKDSNENKPQQSPQQTPRQQQRGFDFEH